jgi:hypothetical protein
LGRWWGGHIRARCLLQAPRRSGCRLDVLSFEVGLVKPDPAIYARALELLAFRVRLRSLTLE